MLIQGKLDKIEIGDNVNTLVMGIINLSPTSFFKGSIKSSEDEIKTQLLNMINDGVDFVDVGAISTAPGFLYNDREDISNQIEIDRLSHFFKVYKEIGTDIPISVDTQSSKTAEYSLSQGATIINDISGFKADTKLPQVISEYSASAIIMACRQAPGDIFSLSEVYIELEKSLNLGIDAGIEKMRMVIDPGLGSWVPQRHLKNDFILIKNMRKLRELKQCILVGISRKSFIGKIINAPPEERLYGSLAATTIAILNGVHIIRTHDVKATKDVCQITDFIKNLNEGD